MIGIIALTALGIPTNFHLPFSIPLVYVLDQAFPIIEGGWFLYERERVLDAVWEHMLKPMMECTITPIISKCLTLVFEVISIQTNPNLTGQAPHITRGPTHPNHPQPGLTWPNRTQECMDVA